MTFPPCSQPGLVSDCPLTNFSPDSCSPVSTANDGLWTSWLAASEAFRYQVTGELQAQSNSWAFFQGLKFLVQVRSGSAEVLCDLLLGRLTLTGSCGLGGRGAVFLFLQPCVCVCAHVYMCPG